MFNRVRIEHMDTEGIDVQVIYGTLNLVFSSLIDKDLAIALCRAYNNYMADDCRGYDNRLKPLVYTSTGRRRRCCRNVPLCQ
jgi:predicted TIM-barrel fold metal-dependent hydrolase